MNSSKTISGFSKLTKSEKLDWIEQHFFDGDVKMSETLKQYWHYDNAMQDVLDGFSENTISNFPMPYGVAPNFMINGKHYLVPMVIEESSVVAAASAAAKFWLSRGGFKTEVIGTKKIGQLHFKFTGGNLLLKKLFPQIEIYLRKGTESLTKNMRNRGGGIESLQLIDFTSEEEYYYQIRGEFETCDSMGANFINSILEKFGELLKTFILNHDEVAAEYKDVQIIMAILSNYTPDCMIRASVSCKIEELGMFAGGIDAKEFADKFATAVKIAHIDPYRATTHNKGIYNGVDSVVLATGNDFRAIESCGHAYASKDGRYKSLSSCEIKDGKFKFWIDLPLAVGTVGGLTKLHPMAKISLQMLGNPSAEELMGIITSVGLAQNFAALRSLITTGIQQGHMKMHLQNILIHMDATPEQKVNADKYFEDKTVSFSAVRAFLERPVVNS